MPVPCIVDGSMGGPTQLLGLTSPIHARGFALGRWPTIQLVVEYCPRHCWANHCADRAKGVG